MTVLAAGPLTPVDIRNDVRQGRWAVLLRALVSAAQNAPCFSWEVSLQRGYVVRWQHDMQESLCSSEGTLTLKYRQ